MPERFRHQQIVVWPEHNVFGEVSTAAPGRLLCQMLEADTADSSGVPITHLERSRVPEGRRCTADASAGKTPVSSAWIRGKQCPKQEKFHVCVLPRRSRSVDEHNLGRPFSILEQNHLS